MSVLGPVDSDELGVTLTHEHIVNDATSWSHRTSSTGWDPEDLATRPVSEDILWDLRHDPFANVDNCRLDDLEVAIEEVRRFADLGGRTILEATGLGFGRDLVALSEVSRATGITIIAGTGFYLDPAIPADVRDLAPEQIAETILADLSEGENGIRPGFIGEIGVGADFTAAERASLAGACIAQRETGLPMQVHLPGWFRLGGDVLDVVESHGVDPARVVLCHMGPSGADLAYQEGLLERGVFVQYDMLGMEVFYADQGVQCPSDEQNAEWLARLVERGHGDRLLLSQDIFLKSLLRRHGGPGYGHVLQYFVPRLNAAGLDSATVEQLMVANPRALFQEPSP
ncbi:phosphotriesterase family protein [Aeromicrobium sp.]|uniref:phosphotriesterase family protein n=1 Tax=Aeromicrobium sp. TaxID=1871063 RepID=UPI003C569633